MVKSVFISKIRAYQIRIILFPVRAYYVQSTCPRLTMIKSEGKLFFKNISEYHRFFFIITVARKKIYEHV